MSREAFFALVNGPCVRRLASTAHFRENRPNVFERGRILPFLSPLRNIRFPFSWLVRDSQPRFRNPPGRAAAGAVVTGGHTRAPNTFVIDFPVVKKMAPAGQEWGGGGGDTWRGWVGGQASLPFRLLNHLNLPSECQSSERLPF